MDGHDATASSTPNIQGGDLILAGGVGSGTGAGGSVKIQVAPAGGVSNNTKNALQTALTVISSGNVGIGTTTPTLGPLTMASGAYVTAGGVWTNASDRNLKTNFATVSPADILQKIDALPVPEWNYKNEDSSIKHIGPIAQDFWALFQLGNSSTSISTIDPAGVGLLGIQALDQKIVSLQGDLFENASTTDLRVLSPAVFSGDSVGQAQIPAGQTSVAVAFSEAYKYQPIVTVTPTADFAGHYWVDQAYSGGFTIRLDQAASSNLTFNWHSFASPEARLTVASGSTSAITLVVSQPAPSDSTTSGSSGMTQVMDSSGNWVWVPMTSLEATSTDATSTAPAGSVAGTSTTDTTLSGDASASSTTALIGPVMSAASTTTDGSAMSDTSATAPSGSTADASSTPVSAP